MSKASLGSSWMSRATRKHQIRIDHKVMSSFNRLNGKITKKIDGVNVVGTAEFVVLTIRQSDRSACLHVHNNGNTFCFH